MLFLNYINYAIISIMRETYCVEGWKNMLKKGYRFKLLIIFLIVTSMPLLFMGVATFFSLDRLIFNQFKLRTIENIKYANQTANEWFKDRNVQLFHMGQTIALLERNNTKQYKKHKISGYLFEQIQNYSHFINVIYISDDDVICDGTSRKNPINQYELELIKKAKKTGNYVMSDPYLDSATETKVVSIFLPVYDSFDTFLGVLAGEIPFYQIAREIDYIFIDKFSNYIVLDNKDNVLWTNYYNIEKEKNVLKHLDISKIKEEKELFIDIDYQKNRKAKKKKTVATYINLSSIDWRIITITNVEDIYAWLNKVWNGFIIISIIAVLIMFISVIISSKKMATPMIQLRDAVDEFSKGNFDVSVPIVYKDEFGQVADSFNNMVNTIKENYIDIARKTAQLIHSNQKLNKSEQKYRILTENISDLLWAVDSQGIIIYVNKQIESILGYKKEDVLGKHLSKIMYPMHFKEYFPSLMILMQQQDLKKEDLCMPKADGKQKLIMEINTKRIYKADKLISIQGIARDVTKERIMQEEVFRRNSELNLLHEISSSLTNTVSAAQKDILLNDIAEKIVKVMDVSICSIRLLGTDQFLEFKTASGHASYLVRKSSISINETFIGRAIKEKKVIVIDPKLASDIANLYEKDLILKLPSVQWVFVPMMIEEETIGVISLISQHKLDESSLNILTALSNNAAVAIEKSKLYENLKQQYFKTIKALAMAVEAKDHYTQGHSLRVAKYAVCIAQHLELSHKDIEKIEIAGILHDIGKIGI